MQRRTLPSLWRLGQGGRAAEKELLILHGDDRPEVLGAIASRYGQVHHSPQLRRLCSSHTQDPAREIPKNSPIAAE
jgi:hypothetical protein